MRLTGRLILKRILNKHVVKRAACHEHAIFVSVLHDVHFSVLWALSQNKPLY
jgi:hypothetical protein